ncbi:toll/interleukin-1 receptor domain-containing protein [Acinetobacter seifertii]|uniref:Toll/interleukin-1 receptor domain-containing protein n=1 Tax=Acinetobacter seifertii TaxID=1530123 RepID=A0A7H2V330_9GAMM|nr:toll/interleukin-1 receptor domain-containing protein [Acinetobacter seifertii]QNX70763.1 toll/interleukin-1 receptor domain-containing protein [Acinetobacter seifertii]
MTEKTKIFISYSHKNENHFLALMAHLNAIAKYNNLEIFTDQIVDIGQDLDETIQNNLKNAHMVVCIVSTDYLNSDYCVRKELEIAVEKQVIDNTKIFPIIAEECIWKRTYFGNIKCAPKDGVPVSKYENIESTYLTIVDQLMNQIERNREVEAEKKKRA